MAEGQVNLPQWINVFFTAVGAVVVGFGVVLRLAFTAHTRLHALENRDIRSLVREELERERHDVLYPMLQTRVYQVLDKIEEETKAQGQNIAILLERDRIITSLDRHAEMIGKSVADAVMKSLNARP